MKVIYFQPRLNAERNYRNGGGVEQVWCPWWALLLHQHARPWAADAALVDARCDPHWRESLSAALAPGCVLAVSVMTGHAIRDAVAASELGRAGGAAVVWGGPHPTLFPEQVAAQPFVDHVVTGFGAQAFGRLLEARSAGRVPASVVDSRGAKGPTPVAVLKGPVTAAAYAPAVDLVGSWEPYVNADQAIGDRAVNLVTSEGCLRRCTYCSEPTTSAHSTLLYDVDACAAVAATVTAAAGADGLKLHDPNFLHYPDRGLRFGALLHAACGLAWAATIHPADLLDLADADLAQLAAYGLRRVLVGLESPVQALVNLAGKRYDTARIPELADKLARHGIAGMFTFIVGWPDADAGHYRATIDAAFALRAVSPRHQAKIHFLEPWPGTPLFTLLARRSPQPRRSLLDWAAIDYYFAHLPLHDAGWEATIRSANEELSPYVEA